MRGNIGFVTCLLVSVLFAVYPLGLLADDAPSYEQLSPNGKYVFVMLSKSPDAGGRVDMLKSRYKHSGLYKVTNMKKSLWRVNWYSPSVHIASDGIHLVRVGRPYTAAINGKPDMAQLAIAFYENGSPAKKYLIKDLITKSSKLTKTKAGFEWQKRIAFDDASATIDVELVTGQTKTFDIKSGKMVSQKADSRKRR
ncbi:MAG: hypothetical protein PHX20_03125 [Candidatus Omnitrophica bacterium]|nr:hypothetical protein [Candidatus Omnitrophota bacterium]